MKINHALLAIVAAGAATGVAPSETIVADAVDASARSNGGSGQATNNILFAGSYYADGPGISPVFPFQLPDLGEGDPFNTATLTLELDSLLRGPVTFNGDIVGLDRVSDTPAVIGEDWGSDGTLLHDDFYTPESPLGVSTTNDFATWLNAKYADGANAGQFVFIRVDTESGGESIVTGRTSYAIATANNEESQKPTLTFTTGSEGAVLTITEIAYHSDPGAESVTLTWRKTSASTYVVKYSLDMTDWGAEVDDSIGENDDENPADPDQLTVTFPISDFLSPTKAFFRIEEE